MITPLPDEGHTKILYAYLARLRPCDMDRIAKANRESWEASQNYGMRAQLAAQDAHQLAVQEAIKLMCEHDKSLITKITNEAYAASGPSPAPKAAPMPGSTSKPEEAGGQQHPDLAKPVMRLKCCCCGGYTKGRQFHNQDLGFGLGSCCMEYVRARVGNDMESIYGLNGVHYNLEAVRTTRPQPQGKLEPKATFQGLESGENLTLTAQFVDVGEPLGHGRDGVALVPKVVLTGNSETNAVPSISIVSADTIAKIGTCRFEALPGFILSAHDAVLLALWVKRHLLLVQA